MTQSTQRGWEDLLADAISVLTEAARLRQTPLRRTEAGEWVPDPEGEPLARDWAEFVTLAVAGAAANVGGIELILAGRPGSWEADAVRSMLQATVTDDLDLLRHRTEPLRVELWPGEYLADIGYDACYDESEDGLEQQRRTHSWRYRLDDNREWVPLDEQAPSYQSAIAWMGGSRPDSELGPESPGTELWVPRSAVDQEADEQLLDLEARIEELRYQLDPAAYGQALEQQVRRSAAELYPDVDVEVLVNVDGWPPAAAYYDTPADRLIDLARELTPLPWTGVAPIEYPPGAPIVDTERAAGRLPHQRLDAGESGQGQ